jgi:hypothetical protein
LPWGREAGAPRAGDSQSGIAALSTKTGWDFSGKPGAHDIIFLRVISPAVIKILITGPRIPVSHSKIIIIEARFAYNFENLENPRRLVYISNNLSLPYRENPGWRKITWKQ